MIPVPRRRHGALVRRASPARRITQSDSSRGAQLLRPHTLEIATLGRSGQERPVDTLTFEFSTESAEVEQLTGRALGDITLLNYSDHDYARVRLDPASDGTPRSDRCPGSPIRSREPWSGRPWTMLCAMACFPYRRI